MVTVYIFFFFYKMLNAFFAIGALAVGVCVCVQPAKIRLLHLQVSGLPAVCEASHSLISCP